MSDSVLKIDTDKKGRLRLNEQLEVLSLPPRQRRKLLRNMAKQSRADVRTNIQRQQTVTGQAMAPRRDKKKRRMMTKMAKGMAVKFPNGHTAVVTWKNGGQAMTAYRHHHGISEKFTAKKAAKIYGRPNYSKPATPAQAKSLNKEGYRRPMARKRGKGGAIMKKVPQKWIRDNMSRGQAGMILRMMRTKKTKGKQAWTIQVPKRPILGATPEASGIYLTAMAREALQNIKRV